MRFSLLDSIDGLEPGVALDGRRCFDPADELFRDHFPGLPLVPGTLLIESMAQAGGWLVFEMLDRRRFPLLVMVESAKFRAPVEPGTVLRIEARLLSRRSTVFRMAGSIKVGGARVAESRFVLRVFEPKPGDASVEHDLLQWASTAFDQLRFVGRTSDIELDVPPEISPGVGGG